ncbi:hypothetical protein N0V88_005834 [Collariella sp. IMI 366227]|nr:hypothetical protein N0V88_005834 [Collariella sp. IMI 366227]
MSRHVTTLATGPTAGTSTGVAPDSPVPRSRRSTLNRRTSTGSDGKPYISQIEDIQNRVRRRGSLLSNYSLSDATRDFQDEIMDPRPEVDGDDLGPITSWKSWLPFTFAILPPLAGLFFKNGASFTSDLCLLGLVAVFLHWSVTAPCDSDSRTRSPSRDRHQQQQQEKSLLATAALRRLQKHEQLALLACFLAPAASACLLFFVRQILTPRTEGLVSGFNLVIFLLAAEVRPLSHSIKLVLSQTLHLQRIVHANPYGRVVQVTPEKYEELMRRVGEVEARAFTGESGAEDNQAQQQQRQQQLTRHIMQEVLTSVHPQIDAITRAVRRYERKSRTLEHRVDAQFRQLDARLGDVAALVSVKSRADRQRRGVIGQVAGGGWYVATVPVAVMYRVMEQVVRAGWWVLRKDWGEVGGGEEGRRSAGRVSGEGREGMANRR